MQKLELPTGRRIVDVGWSIGGEGSVCGWGWGWGGAGRVGGKRSNSNLEGN